MFGLIDRAYNHLSRCRSLSHSNFKSQGNYISTLKDKNRCFGFDMRKNKLMQIIRVWNSHLNPY
jgi:hypothetical protein